MATIMLVDDSRTILASMGQLIRDLGHAVEEHADGPSALGALNKGAAIDLMITDFNMPQMNGAQLIEATRKIGKYRFTPILVLTTETKQERRDEAKRAGATGWLVKPVQKDKLTVALNKLLS